MVARSEDLNELVRRHISSVVSHSPIKALGALEHDTTELIASSMVMLNSKLSRVDDELLVARVVELWTFFWKLVLCRVGPKARKPGLRALSSPARPEPDCGLGRAQGSGLRFGRPKPDPRARAFGA